jgi:hypothetical protein
MNNLTTWVKRHSETLGILLLIAAALGAGVLVGFVLIVIANLVGMW